MAREAMAALRTLEAYRSEFSQTISRFIDETSKNFANVFAKAEGQANDLFSGPPDSQHEAPTRFRKERSRWQLLVRARRTRRPEEDETDDPMLTPN
jgi:hypothetical protein